MVDFSLTDGVKSASGELDCGPAVDPAGEVVAAGVGPESVSRVLSRWTCRHAATTTAVTPAMPMATDFLMTSTICDW